MTMIVPRACRRASSVLPTSKHPQHATIFLRHSSSTPTSPPTVTDTPLPSRWLSTTKARIGKCLTFGLTPSLTTEAATLLSTLSTQWRFLTAGSQGFLTDPHHRAGLHRHPLSWGEMDSMAHVNNTQYIRYAETGRINYIRHFARYHDPRHARQWMDLLSNRGVGCILKSISCEFKFPMTWPDRVSVYHKLRAKPGPETKGLELEVVVVSEGKQRVAARLREDIVVYDYRSAKVCALEGFMVDVLAETWEEQERESREAREEVGRIEEGVKKLEVGSWDREDAKEDFGRKI